MAFCSVYEQTSELSQSEIEIRHFFKHLITTLCQQKWKIIDQISEWSKTLIRQIQDHVNDQRTHLEQVYEHKVSYLDSIRDQFLSRALIFEQHNDTEQMQQLINQCNTLKSDIALLVYIERPITSIQLLTEEHLLQSYQQPCIERRTVDEECQTENTDFNSKLINTISVTQSPPVTQSESSRTIHEILMEKCPLCYMIFPNKMNADDRNLHINEHYRDD
ncbi:hypothetical protein I4U23_024108 [Adineta vaga]|nr:hypothetical protein I4U23_024108 [Adineta vaga]